MNIYLTCKFTNFFFFFLPIANSFLAISPCAFSSHKVSDRGGWLTKQGHITIFVSAAYEGSP